ncbi:MAG TPA: formylglycine-generating enzyme family protein [Pyrinomonadaceae bacterium]|nr:formylglycine-generating enzyme family protein [Pyrinomonadaceae bacterium]
MSSIFPRKRARPWDAIFISLSLLPFLYACAGRKTETTSPSPVDKPTTSKTVFQFETVTLDANGKAISRRTAQGESYAEDLGGGVRLELVLIPAGTFVMGSPYGEKGHLETEGPQHSVKMPQFYMGKFEVTQAVWRAVAGLPKIDRELNPDPSFFKGDALPVEQVSWDEAVEFCKRLSLKRGRVYRLPSEAQWEYAARSGVAGPFALGETITPDIVNYNGVYPYAGASVGVNRRKTIAVGTLGVANAFGLYDMQGNVEEWCIDNWHDNYAGAPADGSAWTSGGDPEYQVLRGGSWYSSASYCRHSSRNWLGHQYRFSGVGFRVVASGE